MRASRILLAVCGLLLGSTLGVAADPGWRWRVALRAPASATEAWTTEDHGVRWRLRLDAPATPIALEISGPDGVRVAGEGNRLELTGADGAVVLTLANITAVDAVGRPVSTRLSVVPPASGSPVWVVAFSRDEAGALFPVFIEGTYAAPSPEGCEGCDEQQPLAPCDIDNDGVQGLQCAGLDCNDNDPTIRPGAMEIPADGIDQDCNGGDTCYTDVDNDNFGTPTLISSTDLDCNDANEAPLPGDCNDSNASIHPGAAEIPGDAVDQDCNGGDTCYTDVDNDNFGTPSLISSTDLDCNDANEAPQPGDCNDSNASIHPGAAEIPGDAVDQDCNGGDICHTDVDNDDYGTASLISSTDLDCNDANEAPQPGDCNDTNQNIYPGAPEIPGNGIDENCDGRETCYRDVDGDQFGTATLFLSTDLDCTDPGEASQTGDCDDTNPTAYPGATEVCNGVDDDCDTVPDDGFVAPTGSPVLTLQDLGGTSVQLSWTLVVPSTVSDAVMGDLGVLRGSGGNFTSSTSSCVANNTASTSATEGSAPGVGGGVWYLVRPVNCQTPGTYDSPSPAQQGLRDSEIAAAGPACP